MRWTTVFVAVVLVFAAVSPVVASESTTTGRVDVIVVFDETADESVITDAGGTITGGVSVDLLPVRFASVPLEAITVIEEHSSVVAVDRDTELTLATQTVPWGIDRIGATNATVNASLQANVTVAVLDTGIDADHEDLNGSVSWGVDTLGTDAVRYGIAEANDDHGHGTHVAGTVAARDNDHGVIGVAPHVGLYAIQVLNADGVGTESDLIEGLDAAVAGPDNKTGTPDDADIVTMSLGSQSASSALEAAIQAAAEHTLLIAAAGNEGDGNVSTDNVTYPARYDEVIAVAATDQANETPTFSSEGPTVELAAPGVSVLSTSISDDQYATLSGTSMAAPHVAGTAALVIAKDQADGTRNLTDAAVRELLRDTARDIETHGDDVRSGHGLVSVTAALRGRSVTLGLTANRSTPMVGDPVEFTVTRLDTNAAVTATLVIGNRTHSTTENGSFIEVFSAPGNVAVVATKADAEFERYRNASVQLEVQRRLVNLSLAANRTVTIPNSTVSFTMTRADTGATVNGTASIGGQTVAVGDEGSFNHSFADPGNYSIAVSKPDTATETFRNDSLEITVRNSSVPALSDELAPPTNLDDDEPLEDVNGNLQADIGDVQAFYVNRHGSIVGAHVAKFDYNGNGRIDIGDVQALYVSLS